nr:DoxX family protein [Acidimicrobiia bacterium]
MRDRALKSRAGRSWSWPRGSSSRTGSRRWPAPPRCSRCSPRSATRAGCGSWLGVAEIAGGIGLLVPRLTTWAAAALGGLMVGAAASELRVGHTFEALIPLQWLVFFVAVVWLRSRRRPRSRPA